MKSKVKSKKILDRLIDLSIRDVITSDTSKENLINKIYEALEEYHKNFYAFTNKYNDVNYKNFYDEKQIKELIQERFR